jgi:hypothetical protein
MKKTLILLGMGLWGLAAQAQDTAGSTASTTTSTTASPTAATSVSASPLAARFIAMPDSLLPLMTKVNREDCVDFLDSHMAARVKNRFGGPTEMTVLTADYLRIEMTAYSTVEMKLLPTGDSTAVTCMVTTVQGPVADSRVQFFDAQWQELPAEDYLVEPVEDAFFTPQDTLTDEYVRLRRLCNLYLVQAQLSPDDRSLTFTYTTPQQLSKEDREALAPYLRQKPVKYEFEGSHFERKEE